MYVRRVNEMDEIEASPDCPVVKCYMISKRAFWRRVTDVRVIVNFSSSVSEFSRG